ncbi:MAG: DNA polymerase III subunit epsilon [Chlamydiae bacterium]|nr:DNA polymerase III subunit epsilon [Chlamydiota bacterium]
MSLIPIYYDTETTGVKFDKDRIIEIAAFDPVNNRTFCRFVNPGFPIPKEATAIHHITDEMVSSSPSFEEVGRAFIDFCGENAVLIAHNNDNFDKFFLEAEAKRNQLSLPSWKYIDTLKWARKYRPDLPRHALQALRDAYGIPPNQAHRALDDVIVLHAVFSQMIDDLSVEQVLELLSQNTKLSRMPFGKHQGKSLSEVPKDYVSWLRQSGAFEKPENKELKESFEALGMLTN